MLANKILQMVLQGYRLQYIPDQLERVSSGEWWDSLLGPVKPDFWEHLQFYISYQAGLLVVESQNSGNLSIITGVTQVYRMCKWSYYYILYFTLN